MTQQQGFSAVVCSVVLPPGKMSENKPGMKEKKKEKTKPLEEAEGGEKKKKKKTYEEEEEGCHSQGCWQKVGEFGRTKTATDSLYCVLSTIPVLPAG